MKLKYYLRGLGAGILFSVLIFVFVVGPKETVISDDEIIQRAKQLGMTEKKEVNINMEKLRENSTPSPTTVPSPTDDPIPEATNSPTPTPTLSPTKVLTPTLSPTKVPTPSLAPTEVPPVEGTDENEVVSAVVEIKSGMRSEDICSVIERAGLIRDAMSLNAYLIQNGYAERLRSGKFELNSRMTFEEIAKMLTW